MPRRIAEAERALIGRPPNLGDKRSAPRRRGRASAVDPLDDRDHRAPTYRRDLVRAMSRRALETRGRMNDARPAQSATMDRPVGRRGWRTRRWSPAAAAFAGDINFPHQLHMRIVRSSHAHGQHRLDRHRRRRARCPASSRCGPRPTSPTCRRSISARAASSSSRRIASRCWRSTRCAMSASRSRRCSPTIPTSPRTPPISSPSRSRNCRRCSTPRRARRVLARPRHRGGDLIRQGYGDVDAVFRPRRTSSSSKLTIGRHSGVPLETRGAIGRYDASRDILELHGAAKVPHRNRELLARMLKPPPASVHVLRVPCRRRLRHPRRALSRGRSGLRRARCGSSAR